MFFLREHKPILRLHDYLVNSCIMIFTQEEKNKISRVTFLAVVKTNVPLIICIVLFSAEKVGQRRGKDVVFLRKTRLEIAN